MFRSGWLVGLALGGLGLLARPAAAHDWLMWRSSGKDAYYPSNYGAYYAPPVYGGYAYPAYPFNGSSGAYAPAGNVSRSFYN
jgi:hypothetical protein